MSSSSQQPEIDELKLDLEELKLLFTQVKRRKNRTLINNQIATIENKINNAPQPGILDFVPSKPRTATTPQASFTTIESYGFDQNETRVHVYVTLQGVTPSTEHSFTCTEQSFDLKLLNVVDSKNYRLMISKLDGLIDKEKSTCSVRTDKVVLTLQKANDRHWLQLPYRRLIGEDFDPEKDDPANGLVGMMQQLYEDGDEDVKREIAKTWVATDVNKLSKGERRN
jgi:calcyclin binding protein